MSRAKSAEYEAAEALFGLRRPRSGPVEAASEDDVRLPRPAGTTELLVLHDTVEAAAVLTIAETESWELREETDRAHLVLASRRWATTTGEQVTWVVDHPGGAQSLRVEGIWAAALVKRLREWLPCHDEKELLDAVLGSGGSEPDPVACIRAASQLAALRPEQPNARHVVALERLLTHPADAVRRAGIRSAYGCRWPQLRTLVEQRMPVEKRLRPQLEALLRSLAGDGR